MDKIEIMNIEKIYKENKPRYLILIYKNKHYSLIIERFGYRDFKFYYEGDTLPESDNIKEEIEDFLYQQFLDYAKWNNLYH